MADLDTFLPQDAADLRDLLLADGYRLTEVDTALGSGFSQLVLAGRHWVRIEVERGYWNLQAGRRRGELVPLHLLIPAVRGVAWTTVFPPPGGFSGAGVHPRGFRWAEEVPRVLAWFDENPPEVTAAEIERVRAEQRAAR